MKEVMDERTARRDWRRGDKVRVPWGTGGEHARTPARVVGTVRDLVKVAAYQPCEVDVPSRTIPTGTPRYSLWRPDDVEFVEADPCWNPFGFMPVLTPTLLVCISGKIGIGAGYPGLTQVGAYQPATDYHKRDPVWAWLEGVGWRPARVIDAKRSWIQVRYLEKYQNHRGSPSGSHRPRTVWPVLCDIPWPNPRFAAVFHD